MNNLIRLFSLIFLFNILPMSSEAVVCFKVPENFKPKIVAAGIFIENEGKLLLLKKHDEKNQWGIPVGKVDAYELPSQAATRELQNKTGLEQLQVDLTYLDKVYIQNGEDELILFLYKLEIDDNIDLQQTMIESKNLIWLTSEDSLNTDLIMDHKALIELYFNNN